jgi:hypothetical protein
LLVIEDVLTGTGSHQLDWFFHFAPGISLTLQGKHVEFEADSLKGTLSLSAAVKMEAEVVEGWAAPRYGERFRAPILHYRTRSSLPAKTKFEISIPPRQV